MTNAPHFLLFSEAQGKNAQGQWRFVLQAADGSAVLEAADAEPGMPGERLELLAVVRGLEALDQPSRVTLFSPSRYVNRGIAYGLDEWRRNGWTWECFGEMVPVKNRDLWQRLDRALGFHRMEFRGFRIDPAHQAHAKAPHVAPANLAAAGKLVSVDKPTPSVESGPTTLTPRLAPRPGIRRRLEELWERSKLTCQQFGTCFLPKPWLG